MSQEIIGEVTVRSSTPVFKAAPIAGMSDLADLLPPNLFTGPVTIRMSGDGSEMMIGDDATAGGARIHLDGAAGDITVRDFRGNRVLRFGSRFALLDVGGTGNEGDIRVRNDDDAITIHLNGSSGDIILRNGDAAEDFDVADLDEARPGTVMVLKEDGRLHPCAAQHDRRVVGVVAGAGSYRPGVILDRDPRKGDSRVPVSIMGKVSVRADGLSRPIRVGDLLTTSARPGRARPVTDPAAAVGAVLGKALTPLDSGFGMVDMLISLQ